MLRLISAAVTAVFIAYQTAPAQPQLPLDQITLPRARLPRDAG